MAVAVAAAAAEAVAVVETGDEDAVPTSMAYQRRRRRARVADEEAKASLPRAMPSTHTRVHVSMRRVDGREERGDETRPRSSRASRNDAAFPQTLTNPERGRQPNSEEFV